MGIAQRFERKLQSAIGDAFARVFGGGVVPQEVEAALQQEATDGVQQLDRGHTLAPNKYVITISESDHEALAADRDLTVKAFARHLDDFIREQGWQTYGDIQVVFESSSALHTGQFRTRGSVDPDVGRSAARAPMPPSCRAPLSEKQSRTQQPHQNSRDTDRQDVAPAVPAEQDDDGRDHPQCGSDCEGGARIGETPGPRCGGVGWIHDLQISSFRLQ